MEKEFNLNYLVYLPDLGLKNETTLYLGSIQTHTFFIYIFE